ncbi:MAG: hypothetical protein R2879_15425 [Saprospiraceae bacterium]
MDSFSRHIVNNFEVVIQSRLKNYPKDNLWKLIVGSLLIAFVIPDLFGSFWKTLLWFFLIVTILDFLALIIRAKFLGSKLEIDAMVEFAEEGITITHLDRSKGSNFFPWDKVEQVVERDDAYIFNLGQVEPYFIKLAKNGLGSEEVRMVEGLNS